MNINEICDKLDELELRIKILEKKIEEVNQSQSE